MNLTEISRARQSATVKIKGGDCPVVALMVLSKKSYRACEAVCKRYGYNGNGLSRVEVLMAAEDILKRKLVGSMKVIKGEDGKPLNEVAVTEIAPRVKFGVVFSADHVMPVVDGQIFNNDVGMKTAFAVAF